MYSVSNDNLFSTAAQPPRRRGKDNFSFLQKRA
jgi:hypothetical protein